MNTLIKITNNKSCQESHKQLFFSPVSASKANNMTTHTIIISILLFILWLRILFLTLEKRYIGDLVTIVMSFLSFIILVAFMVAADEQSSIREETYQQGVKKGLDSNMSMKYVLITDSLYKRK